MDDDWGDGDAVTKVILLSTLSWFFFLLSFLITWNVNFEFFGTNWLTYSIGTRFTREFFKFPVCIAEKLLIK